MSGVQIRKKKSLSKKLVGPVSLPCPRYYTYLCDIYMTHCQLSLYACVFSATRKSPVTSRYSEKFPAPRRFTVLFDSDNPSIVLFDVTSLYSAA
jgi:hypothetical protein